MPGPRAARAPAAALRAAQNPALPAVNTIRPTVKRVCFFAGGRVHRPQSGATRPLGLATAARGGGCSTGAAAAGALQRTGDA